MEDELVAQRDVAMAMARQLKADVDVLQRRETVMEARLAWSETRRVELGMQAKELRARMAAMARTMHHELWLLLLCGLLGGFGGWCVGLCIVLLNGPPVLALLLVPPCVAGGVLMGVACVLVQRKHRDWQRGGRDAQGTIAMARLLVKEMKDYL